MFKTFKTTKQGSVVRALTEGHFTKTGTAAVSRNCYTGGRYTAASVSFNFLTADMPNR